MDKEIMNIARKLLNHTLRLTYVRKIAAPTQIWFDPTRILKEGYLTKSPPLTEETLIRKRFRLRWFVLCYVGVEPTLFYFKDEKARKQGKPKGRISLVGVEVFKQRSKVNGFPFIINIQTDDRLYHLCSTQQEVHDAWLQKLREFHLPDTQSQYSSSSSPCICRCSSGQSVHHVPVNNSSIGTEKQQRECHHSSTSSRSSTTGEINENPNKRPYSTKRSCTANTIIHSRQTSTPSSHHVKGATLTPAGKSSTLDFRQRSRDTGYNQLTAVSPASNPVSVLPHVCVELVIEAETKEDERGSTTCAEIERSCLEEDNEGRNSREDGKEDHSLYYMTMNEAKEAVHKLSVKKTVDVCESEDEGIGRSDSDSSGTSNITSTRNFSKKLLEDAIKMSSNDNNLYNNTYVGPRLSISKQSKQMSRSRSLGDLLEA